MARESITNSTVDDVKPFIRAGRTVPIFFASLPDSGICIRGDTIKTKWFGHETQKNNALMEHTL